MFVELSLANLANKSPLRKIKLCLRYQNVSNVVYSLPISTYKFILKKKWSNYSFSLAQPANFSYILIWKYPGEAALIELAWFFEVFVMLLNDRVVFWKWFHFVSFWLIDDSIQALLVLLVLKTYLYLIKYPNILK